MKAPTRLSNTSVGPGKARDAISPEGLACHLLDLEAAAPPVLSVATPSQLLTSTPLLLLLSLATTSLLPPPTASAKEGGKPS